MKSKKILKKIKDHHEYLINVYFDTPTMSKEEALEIANNMFEDMENELDRLIVNLCVVQCAEHLQEENEQLNQVNDYLERVINRWQEKYIALEKQHKQTRSNFKNSQTHSKNCYKKLKAKYKKLEVENKKLKQAIDILKEKLDIKLEVYHCGGCTLNHKIISNCVTSNERCLRYLEVEEYELLKEMLEEEQSGRKRNDRN